MATLVHDDQLDRAPLRRGIPTVWHEHGPTLATATGDHLFARAFAELVQTGDMIAVSILSNACSALARGEILQREQAGDPTITADDYLQRCRLKTGELFSAAARLGGRFGGWMTMTSIVWASLPRNSDSRSRSQTTFSTVTASRTRPESRSGRICWTQPSPFRCFGPVSVIPRWPP